MKTKPLFVLCVLVILAAISGCTGLTDDPAGIIETPQPTVPALPYQPSQPAEPVEQDDPAEASELTEPADSDETAESAEPGQEKMADLVILVGVDAPEGARATYSPHFEAYPLATFAKITLTVTGAGGNFNYNSTGQSLTDVWKVALIDVPYGLYTITAKAFMNLSDPDTAYAAIGEKDFTFSYSSVQTSVTLNVVTHDGTGTLRYKLTNPDPIGTPITASLSTYTTTPPFSTSQYAALTIDGTERTLTNVPAGYYMLLFGDRVPSIVHIYKDLVTELAETNDIFNLSASSPDTSVQITLNRSGKVREGTTIIAILSGQYEPNSVKLNNGAENNYFAATTDTNNGNGTFTRSFTMPPKSVVVGANKGPTPGIDITFVDPNQHENLRFWSITPSEIIGTATPGTTITVKAHTSFTPVPTGEIPVSVAFWYLDNIRQASSDFSQNFTIPSGTTANRVGAIVYIGEVPHAIDILIASTP